MINDFSIDTESENIHDKRTKEYFKEILESYHSGNYRATVVMLYTVVICDLTYKLQEMRDIYNDEKAEKILTEIEETQKKNPKSPDWESELLRFVSDRTSLFSVSTFENIQILQKHRHLCAHPVLNTDYELFSPNKETTRAHLRNMLEDLFTKRPFLSKNIFDELVLDIAEKREYFPPRYDNIELERYLATKYFDNAPQSTIEYVFKNLWKFTFYLRNKECDANRDINYNVLFILLKRNQKKIIELIKKEKSFFSKVQKGNPIQFLISFLSIFPEIYLLLEEHTQILIQKETERNIQYKIRAWYLSPSITEHLDEIKREYNNNKIDLINDEYTIKSIYYLIRDTNEYPAHEEIINFVVDIYTESESYFMATKNFDNFIRPILKHMNFKNFVYLLSKIETNDQTFNRKRADLDHKLIKEYIDLNYKEIDISKYPNFKSSIAKAEIKAEDEDLPF